MKKKQEISRQEISTTRSKTVTKPEMSVFDKNRREGRVKVVATISELRWMKLESSLFDKKGEER